MPAFGARSRMRVGLPVRQTPSAVSIISVDRLVLGLTAAICLALWMGSAQVLFASQAREGGRVLACRYFTGLGVTERQFLNTGGESDQHGCPVLRVN